MTTAKHNATQATLKGQTIRFTKRALQQLLQSPFPSGKTQIEMSDSECRGLKVIISKSGSATFHSRFHWKYRHYSKQLGELSVMTVENARKDATVYRLSVINGDIFVPESDKKITFLSALSRYITYAEGTKKSHKADSSKLRNHLIPFFSGRLILSDLTDADIRRYLKYLTEKGLSESTCDRHIALLKAAIKYFIKQGWINSSFMPGIKMACPTNGRTRYLSSTELGKFIMACRSCAIASKREDPFKAFEFIAALGVRISEALSCRLEHWDRNSGTLFLPDSKTGERHLILNPTATSILQTQSEKYGSSGLVFRGKNENRPMARPVRAWKAVLEKAQLNDGMVTPHTLRHSHCSHLLMNGVDQFTVSKLMGLSSTACIQRHYGHLSNQTLAKANSVISDVIEQSISKKEEP